MAKRDSILKVLEKEAPVTQKVLARVPMEKADWKPHPKSMSLGQLAGWLAGAPSWAAGTLALDGFDVSKFQAAPVPRTSAGLVEFYESGLAAARKTLDGLDDAAMEESWSFRLGDKALNTLTRFDAASLFLVFDAIHHRGQLSVFLRLLDVPVPSIYGPSADDNPFF
ncbi:MAG: DinB family protein [Thermoanaerobaculia bacterium]